MSGSEVGPRAAGAAGGAAVWLATVPEELFRRRFTDAPIPQAFLDPDGVFRAVNPAMSAVIGLPAEDLVGRSAADFTHPEDLGAAHRTLSDLLAGPQPSTSGTWRYVMDNGDVRWGLTSLLLIRDADGGPAYIASFVQDVTGERRAAADASEARDRLYRSEQRFRALIDRSADAALLVDRVGTITYASPALRSVLGYAPDEVLGCDGFAFVHPDDVATTRRHMAGVVEVPGPHRPFMLRLRAADGRYVATEEAVTNSLDDPLIGGLVLNLRDVSDRVAAERALAATERRYRDIVESAEEGIWVTDADGRTSFVNPRVTDMLGLPAADIVGRTAAGFVHPDDRAEVRRRLDTRTADGASRYEIRLLRADGSPVWVLVAARPLLGDGGDRAGTQAMLTDITDRKQMEEELRHSAVHDQLTGLANRALLEDRIELMLRQERRDGLGAVLFVDLDGFKLINDSFGHAAGDELLRVAATRLRSVVRGGDTVARFGGDEFVIVATDLSERDEAVVVARRILDALGLPVEVAGRQTVVTGSIGIAYTPAASAAALLRDADTAMYRAKQRGRGRVEIFEAAAQEAGRRDVGLVGDLRAALSRGRGLAVHYQPILDLTTGRVVGAEALVRWQHPDLGLLRPAQFLRLADRGKLLSRLDRWVFERAATQAAAWRAAGVVPADFVIAVNVCGRDLEDPRMPAVVREVLDRTGLPPSAVTLEVTEGAAAEGSEPALATLAALRADGVSVALDNFGTGASSLVSVKRIPADQIKIDRSFIEGTGRSDEDDAIVASLLQLGHAIGRECVAVGVETEEQLAVLRAGGCRLAQGHLWSGAVPGDGFPGAVRRLAGGWRRPTTKAPGAPERKAVVAIGSVRHCWSGSLSDRLGEVE